MKSVLAFLMAFVVFGTATAGLVFNGDFESPAGTADGWTDTGGGYTATEETTGGNPGGYVTLETNTWSVWYQDEIERLDMLGIPPGWTITVQCDIKSIGTGNLVSGGFQVESMQGNTSLGGQ